MRNPKVLIYMSCYNHEKYVAEAMSSILGQTYKNWELFVANDGSTDRTGEILSSYQDERIHFYDFRENTKFVGASNFLHMIMKDVDADYIATMSSDDKWDLNKLTYQIQVLTNHPEYKACFTWDKIIFEYEDIAYRNIEDYSHKENQNRYEWLKHFFIYGNCLNACSMLMDKSVFYELGGMNQSFFSLADYRLWIRFVNRYPFYLCEKPLTYYRRHQNNISKTSQTNFVMSTNERYIILKNTVNHMDKTTFVRAFYRQLIYRHYISNEAYAAEKFIFLLNSMSLSGEQAAIDLYLSFSNHAEFLRVLQQDYGYTPQDFTDLTGNGGIIFACNAICGANVLTPKERKQFSPWQIFLEHLDNGKVNAESLDLFSYNVLAGLYQYTSQYEEGKRQFFSIRNYISKLRQKQLKSGQIRILYVIGASSTWDIRKNLPGQPYNDKIFVSYVPKTKTMFSAETANEETYHPLEEGVSCLELYNKKEHCLRFAEELGEQFNQIVYVDCITSDYECHDMIAGYSLAVEQRCILREDIYEQVKKDDANVLALMERIQTYM